jgi:transcriptional regulator with XRE-family HTH domain
MTPRQLREFRKRLGFTQAEFAKVIGVRSNTVARWERGEIAMRESTRLFLDYLVKGIDLTNPVWPIRKDLPPEGEE